MDNLYDNPEVSIPGVTEVGTLTLIDPATELIEQSRPFFNWLLEWEAGLPNLTLAELLRQNNVDPATVAILSADMVVGFCYKGNLASPRIAGLVPAVVGLFEQAYSLGVRHFVLGQDSHHPQATEFHEYGPHCIEGTDEAENIPELARLPFSNLFVTVPKNNLNIGIGTSFEGWLREHPEVVNFIVVGDCTDLCVYNMAMYVKLRANQGNMEPVKIYLPANMVQTYDLPIEVAETIGAKPHPGDLMHHLFLYHLSLNGIKVLGSLLSYHQVSCKGG